MTESQTSIFEWPWQFWRLMVKYFVESPSLGICPVFFSWLKWGYGFLGEDHRANVPFLPLHIKGTCYQDDIISMFEVMFVGLSTGKLTLFPLSILYVISLEGRHYKQPALKRVGSYVQPWELVTHLSYLELFCMGYLSVLPPFIYLIIYLCQRVLEGVQDMSLQNISL